MSTTPADKNTSLTFVKSSYSGDNGECVEVAATPAGAAVRDSKNPSGHILKFPADQWQDFLAGAKDGKFDLPA
jgi:hypothetical protein